MVLTVHIRHESLLMASCICSSPENKIPYSRTLIVHGISLSINTSTGIFKCNKSIIGKASYTSFFQYHTLLYCYTRKVDKADIQSKMVTGYNICCVDLQPGFTSSGGNNIAILQERDVCDGRVAPSDRTDYSGVLIHTLQLQAK